MGKAEPESGRTLGNGTRLKQLKPSLVVDEVWHPCNQLYFQAHSSADALVERLLPLRLVDVGKFSALELDVDTDLGGGDEHARGALQLVAWTCVVLECAGA